MLPRAVALASVMAGRRSIAVAGTHGKTSTTSMLTVAVQACGVDPSFAIGGDLNESGSNAHAGEGDVFVAEADESDRSFLLLAPFGAIVTNVEADHLDNYGDLAGGRGGLRPVPADGRPGRHSSSSAPTTRARRGCAPSTARHGCAPTAGPPTPICGCSTSTSRPTARATPPCSTGRCSGRVRIQLPGEHMALNSAAALLTGLELGLPAEGLVDGLARFGGVHRRFELKGVAAGVRVFDDYAHHPTEVTAQLRAARAVAGDRPAGGGLPAAPVQPDPGVRRRIRRRRSASPTRSW